MSAPLSEPPLAYPDLPPIPEARAARVTRDVIAVTLIALALLGAVAIAWTYSPRIGGLATCALLAVVGVAVGYDNKE
jgi:uncharacterized membrane protein